MYWGDGDDRHRGLIDVAAEGGFWPAAGVMGKAAATGGAVLAPLSVVVDPSLRLGGLMLLTAGCGLVVWLLAALVLASRHDVEFSHALTQIWEVRTWLRVREWFHFGDLFHWFH